MPATVPMLVPASLPHPAEDYRRRGWTVTETADGIDLITDNRLAAVELTGATAAGVRRYLRANNLSGPVLELPGPQRREIHLVLGVAKAARAVEMLRAAGAVVHTDGAAIPLPSPGRAIAWNIAPHEARWVPPLVALSAAVRAAAVRDRAQLRTVAC
ncbi:hypothetical protein D7D52_03280 [Nocardia yunnanensis]|uniref:Uncharacterized protein n=1 Tax=Nocardia yunnanensis TaxID=2382165 RepID=A0A386Z5Y1_9NOCA|nr:hypothetical protein [Nocardia yunnanensis]AYF73050.1 hypothetical protein D7D52_03280 [Nocardia yunnanensis]